MSTQLFLEPQCYTVERIDPSGAFIPLGGNVSQECAIETAKRRERERPTAIYVVRAAPLAQFGQEVYRTQVPQ